MINQVKYWIEAPDSIKSGIVKHWSPIQGIAFILAGDQTFSVKTSGLFDSLKEVKAEWDNKYGTQEGPLIEVSCGAPDPLYEEVNHPDHYNWHPVCECIAVSEHFPANLAQAIQYIWRCGYKPGVEAEKDLKKAIWFLEREISRLSGGKPSEEFKTNTKLDLTMVL